MVMPFDQAVELVLRQLFDTDDLSAQPMAIADYSAGDYAFLSKICRFIVEHTNRGKYIKDFPLKVIVAVESAHAGKIFQKLEACGISASNMIEVFSGSSSPSHFRRKIVAAGSVDIDSILYILHLSQLSQNGVKRNGLISKIFSYFHRDNKYELKAMVKQFNRWQHVAGKFGLLLVLDERNILDKVNPILASAMAGLFAEICPVFWSQKAYIKSSDAVILLHKSPCRIRTVSRRNIGTLLRLEKAYPKAMRASESELLARLKAAPGYQFLLEYEGYSVGILYTQPISDPEMLWHARYRDITHHVNLSGTHLQLISLNIIQSGHGLSHVLLKFIKSFAVCHFESMMGITRCGKYNQETGISYKDYIFQNDAEGFPVDPILRMHVSHGAERIGIVEGYRPHDEDNDGRGVLIRYDLKIPQIITSMKSHSGIKGETVHENSRAILEKVQETIKKVLGQHRISGYSDDISVRDLGLDSMELMDLQGHLNEQFGENLSPTFLFKYPNAESMARYFAGTHEDGRRLEKSKYQDRHKIAIVGMDCRFGGGIDGVDEYWDALIEGRDCIDKVPESRKAFAALNVSEIAVDDDAFLQQGGFVQDMEAFDAGFFHVSPSVAELTDPQQRLLLESVWRALENAGMLPSSLKGSRTGIYIGEFTHDYELVLSRNQIFDAHYSMGNSSAVSSGRLAYFYGTEGPAITVDTACSSSLVALDIACHSLRSGKIDTAIVGGINLILSPELTLSFAKAGMLSPHSRCRPFDAEADGYVRGEGCGILILKRLEDAEKEGNRILAVISGSAVNQDGASNGLTAPNGTAQENVYRAALADAGIEPAEVGYIEAHGTGTGLGDPVEAASIQAVYGQNRTGNNPLWIGSVKSNIGHTESTAGIAGIIKTVLALKNGIIPGTLHFRKLNPHISFHENIFISEKNQSWNVQDNVIKRAAVSSFGFSGTNAHVLLEAYITKEEKRDIASVVKHNRPSYVVLSAKTLERLDVYARNLLKFIEKRQKDAENPLILPDIAYTLQVGREAMEYRLAVIADSIEMLIAKLNAYLKKIKNETNIQDFENVGIDGVYVGRVKQNKDISTVFDTDMDMQKTFDAWIKKGKYERVLEFWVKGRQFDWELLYNAVPVNARPRKINAPCYPFEKKRYWVASSLKVPVSRFASHLLHPLLHINTSSLLSEQKYTSIFTGNEFFLKDHVVNGKKMLPGVTYLEMARAAVHQAIGHLDDDQVIHIHNVMWVLPIVADDTVIVNIGLFPEETGKIAYEVYSDVEKGAERIIHSQGVVEIVQKKTATETIDLSVLRDRCNREIESAEVIYQRLEKLGLQYGSTHRGLMHMYVSPDRMETLAEIALPVSLEKNTDQYVLHPSMLDAALQAAIALVTEGGKYALLLPFALESLRVFAPCTKHMWAWIRYSQGSHEQMVKLDVDLLDEQGNICVQLLSLSNRPFASFSSESGMNRKEALFLRSLWQEKSFVEDGDGIDVMPEINRRWVVIAGFATEKTDEMTHAMAASVDDEMKMMIISLPIEKTDVAADYTESAIVLFKRLQEWMLGKPKENLLVQIVCPRQGNHAVVAGLAGLLQTAGLENPHCLGQVIQVDLEIKVDTLAKYLKENASKPHEREIRYVDGRREVMTLSEVEILDKGRFKEAALPWRDRGIYLITGGLGGLGMIFGQVIAEECKDARLILTGRSPLNETLQKKVADLRALGVSVDYHVVDIGDVGTFREFMGKIQKEYGSLNGIIHCAGVVKDNFIIKKSAEEFAKVLMPKVSGIVNLDEATKEMQALDFFVVFSSVVGVIGNVGQADYAAANAFMDRYAKYREELKKVGKRFGRTVSIIWPLWAEGGMRMEAESEKMMQAFWGMDALPTEIGIAAFRRILILTEIEEPGWMVVYGDLYHIREAFYSQSESKISEKREPESSAKTAGLIDGLLEEKTILFLKKQLSAVLKIPVSNFDEDTPFDNYGIDSILMMRLTNALEKDLGSLPKTLFFEYQTLRQLCMYFVQAYREALVKHLGDDNRSKKTDSVVMADTKIRHSMKRIHSQHSPVKALIPISKTSQEKIAIVGLSGRYPGSPTLDIFWENLREGRDCIIEIPKERWDWHDYFTEDRTQPGRHYSKWGGFIEDVDKFDPLFFNISPREAIQIDPQERLFLEHAWTALEDAGYIKADLESRQVGVYVGVMYGEYQLFGVEQSLLGQPMAAGALYASIANRVSYVLNLHGPSMAVDTMCSSSLTTIYLACQELRLGHIDMAIAGGVNLTIHPNKYLFLSQGQFISSHGHCASFGEGGEGYIPGEGVGVVILKRLSDAVRDGDHIYGVILGSALNHGGKTTGYTVPNPVAQQQVITKAMEEAQVDSRSISYVEAHGTGTSLGDPIEIVGLSRAFGEAVPRKSCWIGSLKSNIGHCESAAGVAGLTKVLLQMKNQQIVPSLHSKILNHNIDFEKTPFEVNQVLKKWVPATIDGKKYPRIASISSFGAGGSNAHLVLEEYISQDKERDIARVVECNMPALVILSAKTEERLKVYVGNLLKFIEDREKDTENSLILPDLAYTLQVGREAMECRFGVLADSLEILKVKLSAYLEKIQDKKNDENLDIDDLYVGQVKKNKDTLAVFDLDEDMLTHVNAWVEKGKYKKILEMWVKGLKLNWELLYQAIPNEARPRRISAPTYPYARERYWVREIKHEKKSEEHDTPSLSILSEKVLTDFSQVPKAPENIVLQEINLNDPLSFEKFESITPKLSNSEISSVSSHEANQLRNMLQKSLSDLLFIPENTIDAQQPFMEIGLDSIVGVEWVKWINEKYHINLPAVKIYDYPTIHLLAGYIATLIEKKTPEENVSTGVDLKSNSGLGLSQGLVIAGTEQINHLQLHAWNVPDPTDHEVQIQVMASGINFPDALCVIGLYPTIPDYPFVPGFEVSGVVKKVGKIAHERFKPGDEVVALTGKTMGGHANQVNVLASTVIRKPKGISFEDACSLPVVFGTAFYAFQLAGLKQGEHVLIHTATGGCGLMALQLAQLKQCVCYATAGKPFKREILKQLGADFVLDYHDAFDTSILELTHGRGVDVVLNMLSGDAIQKGLNCLAPGGRYLEIAMQGLKAMTRLNLSRLTQNHTIYTIDLRRLLLESNMPSALDGVYENMTAMLESGLLMPCVSRIYPFSRIGEALEFVSKGDHVGKVVISHTGEKIIDCTEKMLLALKNHMNRLRSARPENKNIFVPFMSNESSTSKKTDEINIHKDNLAFEISDNKVAIIGMSGQFPGSPTLEVFWNNLINGIDCVSEVPESRWKIPDYYDPNPEVSGKSYCKNMGYLEEADRFDPLFFSLSPKEAEKMDPQQRIFLQTAWHAMEDAGYSPEKVSGLKCGVYVGCSTSNYATTSQSKDWDAMNLMGSSASILAGRIAYFMNLQGPCMAIDTACSSSLVALAEACNSLILGESNLALAGGVSVLVGASLHIMTSKAGMLSPKGRCFAFDQRADGFVPSEGVGVLILKRLSDAIKEGDRIYGVISGWGMNQDGKTNGITAPNGLSQSRLEIEIYKKFKINPETITLVEAHGTGTKLGDPIEVSALQKSFSEFTDKKKFCALGSVKGNIGHSLSAAGISGVIKVILALKHKMLPPAVSFEHLNEHIHLDDSPFYINLEPQPWKTDGAVRRAAVSSFGFSGTNAHVVLEEYIQKIERNHARLIELNSPSLIVLSAKTPERLGVYVTNLLNFIEEREKDTESPLILPDLAYTLQVGREGMEYRLATMAGSVGALRSKLQTYLEKIKNNTSVQDLEDPEIDDLYVGQAKKNKDALSVFDVDEDFQSIIDAWIEKGKYSKLLELWVKGSRIDWQRLYKNVPEDAKPWKVDAPKYPFERERYWVEVESTPNTSASGSAKSAMLHAFDSVDGASLNNDHTKMTEHLDVVLSNSISLSQDMDSSYDSISDSGPGVLLNETPNHDVKWTRDKITEFMISSLSEALYVDRNHIDTEKKFIDMGMDSIIGIEWIAKINRNFAINIGATKIYEFPCINQLSEHIYKEMETAGILNIPADPHVESYEKKASISSVAPEINLRRSDQHAKSTIVANEEIAIIGMSGRYPMSENLDAFWQNLAMGKDCIREIPQSRWDMKQYNNRIYCRWMGMLDDVDCFDPLFFKISPAETGEIDPQQRLFLEESYRALEDAGYSAARLSGKKCGVYLGIMNNEYALLSFRAGHVSSVTSQSFAIAAARISYLLNLHGPAIPIDTACSSSLVAAHLACQALQAGETEMALVGGVTLYLMPESYMGMCSAGMLSHEGRCFTFDKRADGFVPGEGVGVIVLKRLSDAERDGDRIYATIIGSGINQDGHTNGITAPNAASQENLEREIYSKYKIDPKSIGYIETHGTGTILGDPIEIEALQRAFGSLTETESWCALGAVKANIGHTSAAAGIAGIHKVLLSLKNNAIPPAINFNTLNSHLKLEGSPFYINMELKKWERDGHDRPRRAAVSSFGFSGTNAHMVLEEYIPKGERRDIARVVECNRPTLVVLSARTVERLNEYAGNLLKFVEEKQKDAENPLILPDLAYTLQVGREAMACRLAVIADSVDVLKAKLDEHLGKTRNEIGVQIDDVYVGRVKKNKDTFAVFDADEDMQKTIDAWVEKGKYEKLLELWVKGLRFDWETLYNAVPTEARPRRISAPTYPFAKTRYWLRRENPSEANQEETSPRKKMLHSEKENECSSSEKKIYFLKKKWTPCKSDKKTSPPESLLILFTASTKNIAIEISNKFTNCSTVNLDESIDTKAFKIQYFDTILDLTGAGDCANKHIHNTLKWLQGFVKHKRDTIVEFIGVTKDLELLENKTINICGALHASLYRSLHSEFPNFYSRHVDVDGNLSSQEIADQLSNEMIIDNHFCDICYRRGIRYRSAFSDIYHKKPVKYAESNTFRFLPNEVLLITGGTRGLGMLCAKHFVEKYHVKKLILLGKEDIPDRKEWDELIKFDNKISNKIKNIMYLENKGVSVCTSSVDIGDRRAVYSFLENIGSAFGEIVGFIHCAGIFNSDNFSFINKSIREMNKVLSPKVHGLRVLYDCLKSYPVRFNILFSSISAAVPFLSAGAVDYAMANTYMDYFAIKNAIHGKMISIQWANWKDTGMGETKSPSYREAGILKYTDEEGLRILDEILEHDMGAVILPVIANPDSFSLKMLMEQRPKKIFNQASKRNLSERISSSVASELHGTNQKKHVGKFLKSQLSRQLAIPEAELDFDTCLSDLGVDSIILLDFITNINKELNVNIDISALRNFPSLGKILEMVLSNTNILKHDLLNKKNETAENCISRVNLTSATSLESSSIVRNITRIFCFPYAGGQPWIFSEWKKYLGHSIEIYPVDTFIDNSRTMTIDHFVDHLLQALPLDETFIFFGICLGSIIAYELTKRLHCLGMAVPKLLFVASCSAPHLYPTAIRDTIQIQENICLRNQIDFPWMHQDMDSYEFLNKMEEIITDDRHLKNFISLLDGLGFNTKHLVNNKEMMKNTVSRIMYDMYKASNYTYNNKLEQLPIPIVSMRGRGDVTIRNGFVRAWKLHTSSNFKYYGFSGNHWFLNDNLRKILELVRRELPGMSRPGS